MKGIERFFLRARHWQLLTLCMGAYLVASPFLAADSGVSTGSGGTSASVIAGAASMFVCMLFLLGWLGSTGLFLNTLKEPSLRSRTRFLWFAMIFPAPYFFVFTAFFSSPSAQASLVSAFPGLFAMFCIFYVVYFAAKSLAMVEKSGRVTFYDYAGPFFLIWFFPLGVWFVQPRINRHYAQSQGAQAGAKAALKETGPTL